VIGYVIHPHHPGVVWYLLGAVCVITLWTSSEALRWRIKYKRLLSAGKTQPAMIQPPTTSPEVIRLLRTKQRAETARMLRLLVGKGRILRSKIKNSTQSNNDYVPARLGPDLINWETDVVEALTEYPTQLAAFEAQAAILHNVSGLGNISTNTAIRAIEDALTLVNESIKSIGSHRTGTSA
jgi:hypothetical protein